MRMEKITGAVCAVLCLVAVFWSGSSYAAGTSYRIGSADVLAVSIFAGGENQVDVDLTVSGQGYVNFPFLGAVQAAGMTSSELERKVAGPLEREYFVNPQVHIRVREYNSLSFSISGAVKKPGKYEMKAATKIMDLIAKAEGLTPESGNVAYVMRDGGKIDEDLLNSSAAEELKGASQPIKVDLIKLLDKGDMSQNLALEPGDSVYIPLVKGLNQSDSTVYVSGEVEKPDVYPFQPGMSALSVCIMAGGFGKHAAPNRATVVRIENGEQQVININLEDVVKGKIPDVALQPGDRIHVPESWL